MLADANQVGRYPGAKAPRWTCQTKRMPAVMETLPTLGTYLPT